MLRRLWKNFLQPLILGHNMGIVRINGKTYQGNNVSIINGVVKVDGVIQESNVNGVVEIRVLEGTIENLTTDASVTCQAVTGNVEAGGSVQCATVGGSVDAGGSIKCGDVGRDVDAGGSVQCGKVTGRIDSGGSTSIHL